VGAGWLVVVPKVVMPGRNKDMFDANHAFTFIESNSFFNCGVASCIKGHTGVEHEISIANRSPRVLDSDQTILIVVVVCTYNPDKVPSEISGPDSIPAAGTTMNERRSKKRRPRSWRDCLKSSWVTVAAPRSCLGGQQPNSWLPPRRTGSWPAETVVALRQGRGVGVQKLIARGRWTEVFPIHQIRGHQHA
jgi:hypothetical protein